MTASPYDPALDLAAIVGSALDYDEALAATRSTLVLSDGGRHVHDEAFAQGVAFAELRARNPWATGWSFAGHVRDAARAALEAGGVDVTCDEPAEYTDTTVIASVVRMLRDEELGKARTRLAVRLQDLALAANEANGADLASLAFLRAELAFAIGVSWAVARRLGRDEGEAFNAALAVASAEYVDALPPRVPLAAVGG